jgi:hypothetical protein
MLERKKAELAALRAESKSLKGTLYQLRNACTPAKFDLAQREALERELAALREELEVDDNNDLAAAFQARFDRYAKRTARYRREIDPLESQLASIQRKFEEHLSSTGHSLTQTDLEQLILRLHRINRSCDNFKAFLTADFNIQVHSLFKSLKRKLTNAITASEEPSLESIRQLKRRIASLRQKLADAEAERDSLSQSAANLPEIPPEVPLPDPKVTQRKLQKSWTAIQAVLRRRLVAFDAFLQMQWPQALERVQELEARLETMQAKLDRYCDFAEQQRAARDAAAATGEGNDSENLRTVLRIARRTVIFEKAVGGMNQKLGERANLFREQLDREEKDNREVAGTGKTMGELRKAVIWLLREIARLNLEAVRVVEENDAEIERLEAANAE